VKNSVPRPRQTRATTLGANQAADSPVGAPNRQRGRYLISSLGKTEGVHRNITAINDKGELAAALLDESEHAVRAAVLAGGRKRNLGTLGGSFSNARGMNNRGEVVGGSLMPGDEIFHAFIFTQGLMRDLNEMIDASARWELIEAVAISDRGQIIGIGSLDGEEHTFLLTPAGPP
jgi:probable HAF family extracellular repeat protein